MPLQLGAYLRGGQLAAHEPTYERSHGVGVAAKLDRAYQPVTEGWRLDDAPGQDAAAAAGTSP
jgi:hypothetical protein